VNAKNTIGIDQASRCAKADSKLTRTAVFSVNRNSSRLVTINWLLLDLQRQKHARRMSESFQQLMF
jgi:hypothetical protein